MQTVRWHSARNESWVHYEKVGDPISNKAIITTTEPQFIEVTPSVKIVSHPDGEEALKLIEQVGRICYQSQDYIKEGSAEKFVSARLYNDHHDTLLEHYGFTAIFICDRGVANQITRHRMASFAQSSTRYVNFSKEKYGSKISCIMPPFKRSWSKRIWQWLCNCSQWAYMTLIKLGEIPENARSVLPLSLMCQLAVTANLREWRHIFKLRTDSHAQQQTRELMSDLLEQARQVFPIIFDEI